MADMLPLRTRGLASKAFGLAVSTRSIVSGSRGPIVSETTSKSFNREGLEESRTKTGQRWRFKEYMKYERL